MFPGRPICSETIASSVNTNPVHIRRILASLKRSRIISTTRGSHGGYVLGRPPSDISLSEVHQALGEQVFQYPRSPGNPECPAGANMKECLDDVFGSASEALYTRLADFKVADLVKKIGDGAPPNSA